MTDSNTERRQYYRIEDQIGIELRPIDSHSAQSLPIHPGAAFEEGEIAAIRQEIRRLDQDARQQLLAFAERDRQIAQLGKTLNSKLDTLLRLVDYLAEPPTPKIWFDATISEGGIAFDLTNADQNTSGPQTQATLSPQQTLALRLTFKPELVRVTLLGQVVKVIPGHDKQRVHIEFTQLDDSDRQQIARHVLRQQARRRQIGADI